MVTALVRVGPHGGIPIGGAGLRWAETVSDSQNGLGLGKGDGRGSGRALAATFKQVGKILRRHPRTAAATLSVLAFLTGLVRRRRFVPLVCLEPSVGGAPVDVMDGGLGRHEQHEERQRRGNQGGDRKGEVGSVTDQRKGEPAQGHGETAGDIR